jgi:signal transduction histidine kinase
MRSQLQAEAERSAELELFAGRVAHDLMSPLAAAGAALQLAQRQALSPQVVKATERGLAALGRTRQIMDGLLGFARAGAQVEGAPQTRLGDVLPGILEELSPQAEAAGITLLSEFEPEVRVAANPGVLTVMVSNLLRNAVKHMGPSRVRRVCLRAQVVESRALFEVEDTGPGLPPALHRRVFEPFVRGPATGQPGIGLGLATVKRLVEAHGGQVGVHSAEGGGAVFWFSLPLAPA